MTHSYGGHERRGVMLQTYRRVSLPPRDWPIKVGEKCWIDDSAGTVLSEKAKAVYDRVTEEPLTKIAAIFHGMGHTGFTEGIYRGRAWPFFWLAKVEVGPV